MKSEPTIGPRLRVYRELEKTEFFAAFGRLGKVSLAAREVGVKAATGRQWLIAAGIDPKRRGRERRAEYFRLRAAGVSRREAARAVGLNLRTAMDWDQGIVHADNRRVYPDGRVVDYNRKVIPSNDSQARRLLPRVDRQLNPRYLSLPDRERIRDLSAAGASMRSIATLLGRAPSTISRELRRNGTIIGIYEAHAAHRTAATRRARPKPVKLRDRTSLRDYVQKKLRIRWSPEQICHAVIEEFPTDLEMRVSPETIYQALYLQARGGLRREVQLALRTGRSRRKPRKAADARRSRFVDPMIMIADRPAFIEDRTVPGHWESQCLCQAASGRWVAGSW